MGNSITQKLKYKQSVIKFSVKKSKYDFRLCQVKCVIFFKNFNFRKTMT